MKKVDLYQEKMLRKILVVDFKGKRLVKTFRYTNEKPLSKEDSKTISSYVQKMKVQFKLKLVKKAA